MMPGTRHGRARPTLMIILAALLGAAVLAACDHDPPQTQPSPSPSPTTSPSPDPSPSPSPTPDPEPGGDPNDPAQLAEFIIVCPKSHTAAMDPIVFPGQTGRSHSHDFFGNQASGDAHLYSELTGAETTCERITGDTASYWTPQVFLDGQPVEVDHAQFYYKNDFRGSHTQTRAFPEDLRMIAGDMSRGPGSSGSLAYNWGCLHQNTVSNMDFPDCPNGSDLILFLSFPQCWNGIDLDTADHKSHMAYMAGSPFTCPTSHPLQLPSLQFRIIYDTNGATGNRLSIASGSDTNAGTTGTGWTAHGDFVNSWDQSELERLVDHCLKQWRMCALEPPTP